MTAIGDRYEITIESRGTMLLPVSPEGPFPKWSACTRLVAQGGGEIVKRDGAAFKKYTIGKNLRSDNDYFFSGSIWISEERKTLVVDAATFMTDGLPTR